MKTIPRVFGFVWCTVVTLCCVFCVCSCTRHTALDTVALPSDSAVNDVDRFAVITKTYIALQDKPGAGGIVVNHARRNEVYEIIGTQFISHGGKSILWVHLTDGWLERACVELYSSKSRACAASSQSQ